MYLVCPESDPQHHKRGNIKFVNRQFSKEDREDNAHLVKYTVHHGSRLWHHGNQSVQHKKTSISLIKTSFFFLHLHISNNRPQVLICDTLTL